MQKKSIFAILGVMLATIVTAFALVFTVGPSVGAVDINSDEVVLTEKDFHIKDHVLYGLKKGSADYLVALFEGDYVTCGVYAPNKNAPSKIVVQIPEGVTQILGGCDGNGYDSSILIRCYENRDYDYDGDGINDEKGHHVFNADYNNYMQPGFTEIVVTLPSTLKTIGEYAFYYCCNLSSITLPAGVENIEDSAFYGCDGLTEIVIPAGVESLGRNAFNNCYNLTTVTLPTSLRTIGEYAFSGCDSLTEIVIPAGVESLGNYAFAYCNNLTTVTLPASLRTIGESAFSSCHGLTEIVIPAGVESLGNYVFNGCDNLTTVTLPASLTTIGSRIFNYCPKLTTINADPSLMADPNLQYYTVGVLNAREHFNIDDNHVLTGLSDAGREIANQHHQVEVTIPDDVVEISGNNWNSCLPSNAVSVVFSENSELQTIGRYAFYYCDGLTEITIPEHVQSIGEWAFYSCNNLTTVVIPGNVASIGERAFYYCNNLTTVEMQSGVREIGNYAFDRCNNLTTVSIPATVTSMGSDPFSGCYNIDNIIVEDPATLDLGNLRYYQPIVIDQVADFVFADDGALIGLSDDCIQKKSGHQKSKIVIPESVTVIRGQNGSSFFSNHNIEIENVTFPSALTEIGEYAFDHYQHYYSDDENINTFTIPTGVTTIGDYAFSYSGFDKIIIPEGVTKIGEFAFAGCEYLTSITIPASVTEIGEWCFGTAGANSYGLQEIIVNSPELYNNPNLAIYKRIMVKGYEDSENSNNGNQNHNQNQNNQGQVDNNETTNHEVVSNANKFNPLTAWIGGGIAAGLSVLGVAAMMVAKKRK